MMIVQCQACQTRFRIDESRIQGRGARMRCRRCGEAILVMKDSGARPGAPPPKNLFDLRSVLKKPEDMPPRVSEEQPPHFPAWEPPAEEPAETPAAAEPPEVEPPDEPVSLRMTEEAPRETEAAVDETPFPEQEPERTEPETPAAWEPPAEEPAETPAAAEPPEVESPDEIIVDSTKPFLPERQTLSDDVDRNAAEIFSFDEEMQTAEEKPFELLLNDTESLDFLKEEPKRAEVEGELDISGILRSDPSPDPEPVEPLREEAMPDRLEAIQRELQEIGGGSPAPAESPSPTPAAVPSMPPVRETPPLAPRGAARRGSLREGRPSLLPLAILFLLIAGGGAYLGFTPGGQETLRRMVPAVELLWLGGENAEIRFSVGNLIGYYEPNAKAGTLFVIKGTVTNQGRKKRSGIRVQAELLRSGGNHIANKSVFAGNVLSGDALRSSSRDAIEKEMANRWGDKLSNLDIAPGKSIPFMVVFFDAPAGIEEYRIEARDGE